MTKFILGLAVVLNVLGWQAIPPTYATIPPRLCVDFNSEFAGDQVTILLDGKLSFDGKVKTDQNVNAVWCAKVQKGIKYQLVITINERSFRFNVLLKHPTMLIRISKSPDGTTFTFIADNPRIQLTE